MRLVLVEMRRLAARSFLRRSLAVLLVALLAWTAGDHYAVARDAAAALGSPVNLWDATTGGAYLLIVALTLFAFLLGATAIGADWRHGTVTTQLLWEPRRGRVAVAKVVALGVVVTAVAALLMTVYVGGHYALLQTLQAPNLVADPAFAMPYSLGLMLARGLAAVAVAAAMGAALAFLFRNTAGALGVGVAYIAAEFGVRALAPRAEPWLLSQQLHRWLTQGSTVDALPCDRLGICGMAELAIPAWQNGAYLGGLTLVLLAAAVLTFRRRELA